MLSRVKKDDVVLVISGKDKGKQGQVIYVDTKKSTIMVKGVNIVTKHVKAKKQGDKSGIIAEEVAIPLAKVMPICTSCKKSCRVQVRLLEGGDKGKKVRICHRCKEAF
jgi:large subunit ribosomal protein L24